MQKMQTSGERLKEEAKDESVAKDWIQTVYHDQLFVIPMRALFDLALLFLAIMEEFVFEEQMDCDYSELLYISSVCYSVGAPVILYRLEKKSNKRCFNKKSILRKPKKMRILHCAAFGIAILIGQCRVLNDEKFNSFKDIVYQFFDESSKGMIYSSIIVLKRNSVVSNEM